MKAKQNEFGFATAIEPKANPCTRNGRIARAKWWFAKMREEVDQAAVDAQIEEMFRGYPRDQFGNITF